MEACSNAVVDAGLPLSDIDGLSTSTVQPYANAGRVDGVDLVSPAYLAPALGLSDVSWSNDDPRLIGNSLVAAIHALVGGKCRYALVWRALSFPRGEEYGQVDPSKVSGRLQFFVPYGYTDTGASAYASVCRRYMELYGATREHMATLVVNSRRNALLNEKGYWYNHDPEPLTKEQYLSAQVVAEPLCVHDADLPVQACVAYVLTKADRAKAGPHTAYVVGYGQGSGAAGLSQFGGALEPYQEVARSIGDSLWESTGLQPHDIDTVDLYDGFSPFVYLYLEGLGFCNEGEACRFIQDDRTDLGGELPLNTSGGSLGEGRVHGAAHISEAVLQAMGRAGARQVKDAYLTLSTVGFRHGGQGQAMVFSREPL